ncbi:cathelicidin-related antimicrobial peptide Na_CRAMP-like [Hypanus sabinus]|uniref:cathelicidin-related antimicrobial peptide Na_CRAMP-like n=1 Tax=Hypanus sabinus TaxID=79690 RepID=UPI0028C387C3|nr:cathelicidin-related antimicrobial peptide Na_CRAMP-like [Hypanus sabinus]
MKMLQKIILLVGFLTLTASVPSSTFTGRQVASAAVARYNKRWSPVNLFKLLQVTSARLKNGVQWTIYDVSFHMQETVCNHNVTSNDAADCSFMAGGIMKSCTVKAFQRPPSTSLRFQPVRCKVFQDMPVLARQVQTSSSTFGSSPGTVDTTEKS